MKDQIKQIRTLRRDGFSDKRICRRFNQKGILAPFGKSEWTYVLLKRFEEEYKTKGPGGELFVRLANLSGPFRQPHKGMSKGMLYGSFHFEEFYHTKAWRNTLQRFYQFGVPNDLSGKTVLDVGSNSGAMSFEFAKRGAKVVGLEYNKERVDVCNELVDFLDVNAVFHQVDLNIGFPEMSHPFDIVICTAVDIYMKDRVKLYEFVSNMTKGVCYFESNYPETASKNLPEEVEDIKSHFRSRFSNVMFIGQSGRRRVFAFSNKGIRFRRTPNRLIDGWHERKMMCYDEWKGLKEIYEKVRDIPQCVEMDFSKPFYTRSKHVAGETLTYIDKSLNPSLKESLRKQMISFVAELIKRKVAHRDIHGRNVIVSKQGKLVVIDWEFLVEDQSLYDLTGRGPKPPSNRDRIPQTIFTKNPLNSLIPVSEIFGITKEDFLMFA